MIPVPSNNSHPHAHLDRLGLHAEHTVQSLGFFLYAVSSALVPVLVDIGPPLEDHTTRPTLEDLPGVQGVHMVFQRHLAGEAAPTLGAVQTHALLDTLLLVLLELASIEMKDFLAVPTATADLWLLDSARVERVACRVGCEGGRQPCRVWGVKVRTCPSVCALCCRRLRGVCETFLRFDHEVMPSGVQTLRRTRELSTAPSLSVKGTASSLHIPQTMILGVCKKVFNPAFNG